MKGAEGRPDGEGHRARSGRVPGTGASVPVELGCSAHPACKWVHQHASSPTPCWGAVCRLCSTGMTDQVMGHCSPSDLQPLFPPRGSRAGGSQLSTAGRLPWQPVPTLTQVVRGVPENSLYSRSKRCFLLFLVRKFLGFSELYARNWDEGKLYISYCKSECNNRVL